MADGDDDFIDRGAWSDDDQAATAVSAWPLLPDVYDEGSDVDRGARAFARAILMRKLNAASTACAIAPTVVLLHDNWRHFGKSMQWKNTPEVDDGSRKLSGFLFVAPPNFAAAYATALPSTDLGEVFTWIEDDLKLGHVPAIILNPMATIPELRIYENGVLKSKQKRSFTLYLSEFNLTTLDSALCQFWENVVCAPSGGRKCQKLWADPKEFVAVAGPEKVVQDELCRFLRVSLPRLNVKDEENVRLGRLDVRLSGLVGADKYTFINHAVIELKILRSRNKVAPFENNKTTKKHITKGVRQAAAYRKPPEPTRIAILACYDMRPHAGQRKDTCFAHVIDFAKHEDVELRRWPLFPTVEAYREFVVPDPGTGP